MAIINLPSPTDPIPGLIHLNFAPDQARYSGDLAPNAITTPVEHGAARTRQDYIGGSSLVNVQWSVDPTQYQTIVSFFEGILSSGTMPFSIDLILNRSALHRYEAKLVADTLRVTSVRGLQRVLQAQLEVIRDPAEDLLLATEALLNLLSGNDIDTYLLTIEETVNTINANQAGLPT